MGLQERLRIKEEREKGIIDVERASKSLDEELKYAKIGRRISSVGEVAGDALWVLGIFAAGYLALATVMTTINYFNKDKPQLQTEPTKNSLEYNVSK